MTLSAHQTAAESMLNIHVPKHTALIQTLDQLRLVVPATSISSSLSLIQRINTSYPCAQPFITFSNFRPAALGGASDACGQQPIGRHGQENLQSLEARWYVSNNITAPKLIARLQKSGRVALGGANSSSNSVDIYSIDMLDNL